MPETNITAMGIDGHSYLIMFTRDWPSAAEAVKCLNRWEKDEELNITTLHCGEWIELIDDMML